MFQKRILPDLKGIEDFSNLSKLECYTNRLTSLDFTHNTALRYLDCQENKLTSLGCEQKYINSNLKLSIKSVAKFGCE